MKKLERLWNSLRDSFWFLPLVVVAGSVAVAVALIQADTAESQLEAHPAQETPMHSYRNFILMIAVSATLMFGLTYLNTYQPGHVWFSQTRLFMTFIMAGSMSLVMLFFMRHMYKNKQANISIAVGSVALMALGLWLVRSQATVGDVAWMKAMIPHHSIAILTSERASIADPRVRSLADEIIEAQRREIEEMEALIRDIDDQSAETSRR